MLGETNASCNQIIMRPADRIVVASLICTCSFLMHRSLDITAELKKCYCIVHVPESSHLIYS